MRGLLSTLLLAGIVFGGYFAVAANTNNWSPKPQPSAATEAQITASTYCGGVGRGGDTCNEAQ